MTTMEDLTKTQIVLLTLLVSFITSIATGIITTSLLAEAPQNVTQTIDRVVERTIEKVAPAPAGQTVREVTIVKEGDAVVSSIESANKALVRIKSPGDTSGFQDFYALGVVVSRQGHILTDRRNITQSAPYSVVFPDGSTAQATVVKVSETGSMALLKIDEGDPHLKSLTAIPLSKSDPKLGQTVIAMQGRETNIIAVGRVLSIDAPAGVARTDLSPAAETQGGPLLNLSGELVGLKTSNSDLTLPAGNYTIVTPLAKFVADNS
jgi:S1-C subfamily serine protease